MTNLPFTLHSAPTRLTSDSYENPLYVEGPSPSYPAAAPQHYDFDQAKPE